MIVLTMKKIKQEINIDKFRARRGSALMMVVILFLITSILGVAVLAIAATERNQIIAEEKLDQAYYNARAVVQAAADWIEARHNDRDQMDLVVPPRTPPRGEKYARTTTSELNGDEYTLRIWRDDDDADLIHIAAKTSHDGLPGWAALELQETISGFVLFEDAIYSKGPFGKSSGNANNVYGSVATGHSSIPDNLNATGAKTVNKIYEFEDILPAADIVFPTRVENAYLGSKKDIVYINDTPNLNADYGTLRLHDYVYIRNTDTDNNPQDVHIQVKKLIIDDKVSLHPKDNDGGRIFIYVTEHIQVGKKFDIDGSRDAPVVYLICSGNGDIDFSGNSVMCVYIYGPDVNVEYGGSVILNGAIIANCFGWNGNIHIQHRKPNLSGTPFDALNQKQRTINISGITWK